MQNPSAHARSELAVARALGQIADQAYEIAEASTLWLGGDNRLGCTQGKTWLAA
jgi:phosphate uptake regulator